MALPHNTPKILPFIWILAGICCTLTAGDNSVVLGDGKLLRLVRAQAHKRQIDNPLPASQLSALDKQSVISLHLGFREEAGAGAGNMLTMEYAEDLANLAQATAETCIFGNANVNFPDNGTDVGQIIFRSQRSDVMTILEELFREEQGYYDYNTNTCQTGQTCENYKQVVWYNSKLVGCGKAFCPVMFNPGNPAPDFSKTSQWFWVCNYYEPSYDGHPYLPSTEPCSLCNLSPGTACNRNMCSTCDPTTDLNCRAQNETACVEDNDPCCPTWEYDTYCNPGTPYYPYMSENCAAWCEITYCGPI